MKKTIIVIALFFLTTVELICQTQLNYRLTSMKQFTAEGIYYAEVKFIYNAKSQLVTAINYDYKGEITSRFEYLYTDDGKINEKKTVCGKCGSNSKYHRYDYDEEGKLVRKSSYDDSDMLIEYTIFEYDGDKIKMWKVFDQYEQQTAYGTRKYNNNETTRLDVYYSKEGKAISRMISMSGQSGMRSELQYYKDESLYWKMLFEYSGSRLNRIKLMGENNTLQSYLEITTEDNASYVDIFEFIVLWEM